MAHRFIDQSIYQENGQENADRLEARQPQFIHTFLLMIGSCLPILGGLLIAPVLPTIQAHFSGVPSAELLVPITLTVPALVIAVLAPFAGVIVDTLGRKRPLVIALILYGVFGTAPLWLDSLGSILLSRAGVGLTEAVIMTCCTTLIGDYYDGAKRSKYLALQTTVTSISASVFLLLGGALGEFGWRAPFWAYAISLLIVPAAQIYLWEPERDGRASAHPDVSFQNGARPPFRPRLLLGICAVTLVTVIAFYIVPVHLAYLLNALGTRSPRTIGLLSGLTHVTVVIGTVVFHRLSIAGFNTSRLLALSLASSGLGLLIVASATTLPEITTGVLINGFGSGVLLPTLLTWNIRILPVERRGLGTGAWTASFFLGQFVNPIAVISLAGVAGGRADAVRLFGFGLLALAGISLAAGLRYRRPVQESQ